MVNLHSHAHYEIYYLTKGNRYLFLSSKLYELNGPEVIIIPPYTMHKTEGGPYERYTVNVNKKFLNDFQCSVLDDMALQIIRPNSVQHNEFSSLLSELVSVNKHEKHGSYIIDALFSYFVLRLSQLTNMATVSQYQADKTTPTMLKIIAYMNKHYAERLTLDELAQKFSISKATLNYNFKNATACTPMDFLLNIRLTKAKKLLMETNKSINQISDECGFSSPNYFGFIFKKKELISPAIYRKINR